MKEYLKPQFSPDFPDNARSNESESEVKFSPEDISSAQELKDLLLGYINNGTDILSQIKEHLNTISDSSVLNLPDIKLAIEKYCSGVEVDKNKNKYSESILSILNVSREDLLRSQSFKVQLEKELSFCVGGNADIEDTKKMIEKYGTLIDFKKFPEYLQGPISNGDILKVKKFIDEFNLDYKKVFYNEENIIWGCLSGQSGKKEKDVSELKEITNINEEKMLDFFIKNPLSFDRCLANISGIIYFKYTTDFPKEINFSQIISHEDADISQDYIKNDIDYVAGGQFAGIGEVFSTNVGQKFIEKTNSKERYLNDIVDLFFKEKVVMDRDGDTIEHQYVDNLLLALNSLGIDNRIIQDKIKLFFESSNIFEMRMFLNDAAKKPFDVFLKRTANLFGDFVDEKMYKAINDLSEGKNSEDFISFGIKKTGNDGINQLEQRYRQFKKDILREDFNPQILLESNLASKYFKNYIRFPVSQWTGEGHSFEDMVERYIEVNNSGEYSISPLNPEFTPSGVLYVDTGDKSNKDIEYSESFLNRFKTISGDIQKAKEQYLSKAPLSEIVSRLEEKRKNIVEELTEKIEKIVNKDGSPNEKGRQSLSERLTKLKELKLRSLADFQKNFAALTTFKELEPDLRQAMFVMGFAKNRTQLEKDMDKVDPQKPTLDDTTWMMNFVDHMVNKETMSQYFTDKQARDKFRELINIKSFEEELSRFQNKDIIGTLPMEFIPTRGILMEFSGHIADACWADKYKDTIPATFPNFTAVTMVQNPGTKHERLCGSCMIIETNNESTGEPLLVIRGLNPIENTINGLQVSDFYEKFTNYTKMLAEKTGRKLAIVINNYAGGSSTNRPLLLNYLSSLNLEKARVPYEETEFNGYNVTNNVYLVKR